MRPLSLTMCAFAPYAGSEHVDFNALSSNLFLVCGDTGAGKTTIFDGISYALYGEASGETRTADSLRSQYAPPELETYVDFVFSLRSKTYTVKRSPGYKKLSARTGKETATNPKAALTLPDGKVIANPMAVNAALIELIGLSRSQFSQIAMIAQGEFRKLLLAKSGEREAIFRDVFGTGRLKDVQTALKTRAQQEYAAYAEEKRSMEQAMRTVRTDPQEERYAPLSSIHAEDAGRFLTLLDELLTEDAQRQDALKLALTQAEETLSKQQIALASAVEDARLLEQLARAQEGWAAQEQLLPQMQRDKQHLLLGERANAEIRPLQLLYLQSKKAREAMAQEAQLLQREIDALIAPLQESAAQYAKEQAREPLREEARQNIHALEALLPEYGRLELLHQAASEAARQAEQLRASLSLCRTDAAVQAEQSEQLSGALRALDAIPIDALRLRAQAAAGRCGAIASAMQLHKEAEAQKAALFALQQEYAHTEARLSIAEQEARAAETAFLRAQAGLLAQTLEPDAPCPVCGSPSHPSPASLPPDAPDEATVQRKKWSYEQLHGQAVDLSRRAAAASAKWEAQQNSFTQAAAALFATPIEEPFAAALEAEEDTAQAALQELTQSIAAAEEKLAERETLQMQHIDATQRQQTLATQAESLEVNLKEAELRAVQQAAERDALCVRLPHPGKAEAQQALRVQRETLQTLQAALEQSAQRHAKLEREQNDASAKLSSLLLRLPEAEKSEAEAYNAYTQAISAAGFPEEAAYLLALRTPEEWKAERSRLARYGEAREAARSALQQAEQAAAGKQRTDLSLLQAAVLEAQAQKDAAAEAHASIVERIRHNRSLYQSLDSKQERLQRLWSGYSKYKRLSDTANGELPGRPRLTFERYVQARYLDEVLLSANARLYQMTGGQYELVRRQTPNDLRVQTGLDLDVLDHYSGKPRAAYTLSGGESFLAALSLALGLADTVQRYAGGIQLDAMFVDEGFGSLDGEALERAVRILSGLAGGDRMVGVISHVEELKARIESRIYVKKTTAGSHIEVQ